MNGVGSDVGYELPANMTEKLERLACALQFPLHLCFCVVFVLECCGMSCLSGTCLFTFKTFLFLFLLNCMYMLVECI